MLTTVIRIELRSLRIAICKVVTEFRALKYIFYTRRCDECFTNYVKTWRSKIPANYKVGSADSLLDKCDLPNRFVILVLYKVKPVPRAGRIVFSHLALIIACLQDDTISEPAVKLIRQLEREASHSGKKLHLPVSHSNTMPAFVPAEKARYQGYKLRRD